MRPTAVRLERRLKARLSTDGVRLGSPELMDRVVDLARGRGVRRALDLGTGCGELLPRLRAEGIPAMGLDLCRAPLERARQGGAPLLQADLEQLPVAAAQVDLVTCLLVLHYLKRPARALSEAARVLRGGGWLILADRVAAGDPALRSIHQDLELRRNPAVRRLFTSAELGDQLQRAGFRTRLIVFVEESVSLDTWLAGVEPDAARRIRRELEETPDLGGLHFESPDQVRVRIDLILAQRT